MLPRRTKPTRSQEPEYDGSYPQPPRSLPGHTDEGRILNSPNEELPSFAPQQAPGPTVPQQYEFIVRGLSQEQIQSGSAASADPVSMLSDAVPLMSTGVSVSPVTYGPIGVYEEPNIPPTAPTPFGYGQVLFTPFTPFDFAFQTPYPYAMESLPCPPWSTSGSDLNGPPTQMLFPSSAFSSSNILAQEAIAPILYDYQPNFPVFTPPQPETTRPTDSQDGKRRRLGSPSASTPAIVATGRTSPLPSRFHKHRMAGEVQVLPRTEVRTESSPPQSSVTTRRGRQGPMSASQREKVEAVRFLGACWRCRRYKKPCNAGAAICNHCLTSGLRLWPGTVGCRKGDFKIFAISVLPEGSEDIFKTILPMSYPKPNNWRRPRQLPAPLPVSTGRSTDSKWNALYLKMEALHIFGPELLSLLTIMEKLSNSAKVHASFLEPIARSLSLSADFYFSFVRTVSPLPEPDLIATVIQLRESNIKAWNSILAQCLTGKLCNWPDIFIASCIVVCSVVIFTDALVCIPGELRDRIWPDTATMVKGLREQLYMSVIEMLVVLAKGAKPLKFKCWDTKIEVDEKEAEVRIRNAEGMRLLQEDKDAFDAMSSLQQWAREHRDALDSDEWFESKPFNPSVIPISSVSRLLIRTGGLYSD